MRQPSAWPAVLLSVALAGGCTGAIPGAGGDGDEPGPPDGTTPGGPTTPGAMGSSPGPGGGPSGADGAPSAPLGPITSVPVDSTRLARLSHRQYENTVRDLLRLTSPPNLASTFVTEPVRGKFDNAGGFLQVSPGLWLDYQRAAEAMADLVVKDARRLAALLPANLPADPAARARAFVEGFGLRAYRRPLTAAEVDQALALFNRGAALVASGNAFNDGVHVVLLMFLQSPHFLYRTELVTGAGAKVPLTDHEVAAKLSYALTNTMPDDMLFAAAAAKTLTRRETVIEHARRLLGTPAAQEMVRDFHAQLLNMVRYDQITKDKAKFPEYFDGAGAAMKTETQSFVQHVVFTEDKGLTALLLSPFTFANAQLARIYGNDIVGAVPTGTKHERVELDPAKRAGLLTQLGFLASYADGSQPQTILRGAFVNHDILCRELPPPPDAFTLPPSMGRTNRQRVEAATHVDGCAGCHQKLINPPGFGLEAYDALGRHRTMDGTSPVDARSTYPFDDGERAFDGGVELSRLVAGSRQAHDCYAKHWLEYVYGRLIDKAPDKDLAAQLGARSLRAGASVRALILEMVATDAFLSRTP